MAEEQVIDENIEETPKSEQIEITQKKVKELTDDEKMLIIENAKNGVENQYFDVIFAKNGKHRIVLKKQPKQTVAQQQINSRGSMLTNDQLLLEHVLDLEARFAKMEMKTKKLKKKYKNLKHDIYVDTDEETPGALKSMLEPTEKQQIIDEPQKQQQIVNEMPQITRPPVSNLRGWRARIAAQY